MENVLVQEKEQEQALGMMYEL